MNDAQSTISGLNSQDCPGGGWNGMPLELERATVADCLAHGVCGCIYGDAVQLIERQQAALEQLAVLGEQGMKPDYGEWLTFHDKVTQVARNALSPKE